jgi:hypothetical protein
MTHDPTRDCQHGCMKGKCEVCDLQAEVERLKAAQPALSPMHASGLVAIKTLLSRDPCVHAKLAIEMIDAMLAAEPQPVPVKTYHDGKPWPVAPMPWVGLTDEEAQWIYDNGRTPSGMMEMVEAKLKEKNT